MSSEADADKDMSTEATEANIISLVMTPDFLKVSDASKKFCPFDVLRLKDHEIRHSNMLAWLLDPNETHGLGDAIALRFVLSAYRENSDVAGKIKIAEVYSRGLGDIRVHRELANIDILLVSDACKLVVLVENKWHSSESEGQLDKYLEYAKKNYENDGYDIFPLLLTLDGSDPSDSNRGRYGRFSYDEILELLKEGIRSKESQVSDHIFDFIGHYINLLEEKLGMSKQEAKLDELCREIYSKHKKAIDRIYEVGNDNSIAFSDAVREFCEQVTTDLELSENRNLPKVFSFVPKSLFSPGACVVKGWNRGRHAVACWFELLDKGDNLKIVFVIEAGPVRPGGVRVKFLEKVEDAGLSAGLTSARSKNGGMYSRIGKRSTQTIKDFDGLAGEMKSMYEARQKDIEKLAGVIRDFDWSSAESVGVE